MEREENVIQSTFNANVILNVGGHFFNIILYCHLQRLNNNSSSFTLFHSILNGNVFQHHGTPNKLILIVTRRSVTNGTCRQVKLRSIFFKL